jgi:hypothetical protein
MPAAPTAPPPPTTAPAAQPARPAAPAAAAPAGPATPAPPATPGKVSNPFDDSFADMERFADEDSPASKPPGAPKPPAKPGKPAAKAAPEPPAADEEAEPAAEEGAEDPEAEPPAKPAEEEAKLGPDGKPLPADGKPGKTSPWKLVESYKKTNTTLQKEIADLRAAAAKPGELPKEAAEKFAAIEARNKELEDEIRYVNYSKSKEFVDTYQAPYEEAWANALGELRELTITNEDGTSRTATAQDLLALSNMPLGQARATAKAWFGDSADDIMAHRRTIRELSDKQTKALDAAKKNGSQRDEQRTAEMSAKAKARTEEHGRAWQTINAQAQAKYEYLRPAEGQEERNQKLEKAVKFVDETLGLNVNSAKTQEERDQILSRHAAIRNRAIGFSVLKHENSALRAELETLKKELEQFQGSEPTGGEPRGRQNGEAQPDTLDGAVAGMARYAT